MKRSIVASDSAAIFGRQPEPTERQVTVMATHVASLEHRVIRVSIGSSQGGP